MSTDQQISDACQAGDDMMEFLVSECLVERNVLFDESREETGEDSSGFTEAGRDLFEFVYSLALSLTS
jgi:hypothetical protein